jgi:hypothetical protein
MRKNWTVLLSPPSQLPKHFKLWHCQRMPLQLPLPLLAPPVPAISIQLLLLRRARSSLTVCAMQWASHNTTMRFRVSSLQAHKLIQIYTNTDYCLVAFCTWILTTRHEQQRAVFGQRSDSWRYDHLHTHACRPPHHHRSSSVDHYCYQGRSCKILRRD